MVSELHFDQLDRNVAGDHNALSRIRVPADPQGWCCRPNGIMAWRRALGCLSLRPSGTSSRGKDPSPKSRTAAAAEDFLRLRESAAAEGRRSAHRSTAGLHAPHGLPFKHFVKQFHKGKHKPNEALAPSMIPTANCGPRRPARRRKAASRRGGAADSSSMSGARAIGLYRLASKAGLARMAG